MKAAFTVWDGRISPVFDVAKQLWLIDVEQNQVVEKQILSIPEGSAMTKLAFLREMQVELLVCGAISKSLLSMIEDENITVFPFRAGEICEVIKAVMTNHLNEPEFLMPGCGRSPALSGNKESMDLNSIGVNYEK